MQSCLYFGRVRHQRRMPVSHAFTYRMFLLYLDLDELDAVFRRRWLWSTRGPNLAWYRRADFHGDPSVPLADAVRDLVERRTGRRPEGPIRLLAHLRYWGFSFNPVSFYYCFDAAGERVETVVAEITNTPWGERHAYVLDRAASRSDTGRMRFRFPKEFHISPFMEMTLTHDWRLGPPGRRLAVRMENLRDGVPFFEASLSLRRRPLGARSLAAALITHPFMTAKVLAGIYLQALRLRLKGAPFHPHPATALPKRARGGAA